MWAMPAGGHGAAEEDSVGNGLKIEADFLHQYTRADHGNQRALLVLQQAYQDLHGAAPLVKVIHAGLECGLIGKAYPQIEMVSFGPTIRGAHSPDERVEIASVAQFWELLKASLAAVPPRN